MEREIELFDVQHDLDVMLRRAIRAGRRKIVIGAPTGSGKTVMSANWLNRARKKGNTGAFFCDRIKLVNQTSETLSRYGIPHSVRQGAFHPLEDPYEKIQVASIKTVMGYRKMFDFDFALIDEAHTIYDVVKKMLEAKTNQIFIGLTATPYTKGMGDLYDHLIVPFTTRQLIDKGLLVEPHYYRGERINLKECGGGKEYSQRKLEKETEKNMLKITGDIERNWFEHGENGRTAAFTPSVNHSKYLVEMFNGAGISAEHIDGYMPQEQAQELYEAHANDEFKVLSNSRILNTGYDDPGLLNLIDCYPVKSVTTWVQRGGRVIRRAPGKTHANVFDHSGNTHEHGYFEDIWPVELHSGKKPHSERKLTNKRNEDKKERKERTCPKCKGLMVGIRCNCGYEIPISERFKNGDGLLKKDSKKKKATSEEKQSFYSQLLGYREEKKKKGKVYQMGWVAHKYREKFGVWPKGLSYVAVQPSQEVRNFLTHSFIKYEKGKAKA